MSKGWKNNLLKSGIPLEYEVKKVLEDFGCVGKPEYTYFRKDEYDKINEFSYDLDYAYIKSNYFIKLMIECKYRYPSAKWIFLPEDYGGMDDTNFTDFLNPCDYFNQENNFTYDFHYPHKIGSLCSKGIELLPNDFNPKSITQAKSQLSYAMAEQMVNSFEHQVQKLLGNEEFIICHIPIIVTTADLYRLNDDISIEQIKSCNDIEEISKPHEILVLKSNTGTHLEKYNQNIFSRFIMKYGENYLNGKLNSFNDEIGFVLSVISEHYCPSTLLVVHHDTDSNVYKNIFEYLDEIVIPSEKTINLIRDKKKEFDQKGKELFSYKNPPT